MTTKISLPKFKRASETIDTYKGRPRINLYHFEIYVESENSGQGVIYGSPSQGCLIFDGRKMGCDALLSRLSYFGIKVPYEKQLRQMYEQMQITKQKCENFKKEPTPENQTCLENLCSAFKERWEARFSGDLIKMVRCAMSKQRSEQ